MVIGGYFASIEKAGFATFISLTRSLIALVGCMMLLIAVLGGEGIWWSPSVVTSNGFTDVFSTCKATDIMAFEGKSGDNYTGATVGGYLTRTIDLGCASP